jgi:3-oxoacyl-[acyl-carrier protein] reductase
MNLLEGKVAIVTGAGLPKGMGSAAARELAKNGAKVVVTDLEANLSGLEKLVKEIEALGSKGIAITVDVTNSKEIEDCVKKTTEVFGGVDILFNNAGVGVGTGPFLEISEFHWDLSMKVNVIGMASFCKAVIPEMLKREGGSIINNSSNFGLGSVSGYSAYSASKFAAVGLTKSIAAEFGDRNIRCNAICPGNIYTDMGEVEVKMVAKRDGISDEDAKTFLSQDVAMKRYGKAEEVAETVAFLASDKSSYITGIALQIHGGQSPGL